MDFTLSTPIAGEAEITKGKILKWYDDPNDRTVQVSVRLRQNEDPRLYTLWYGADYEAIGDWTTAQAVARLNELIEANVFSMPPSGGEE